MKVAIIILAAGNGLRMQSDTPKVLQPIAGKPILMHVMDTVNELLSSKSAYDFSKICIVVNKQYDLMRQHVSNKAIQWVVQLEQKGTGDAVKQALPFCSDCDVMLVIYGDMPFIRSETLLKLLDHSKGQQLTILTSQLANPTGYGRIIRNQQHKLIDIVEETDATKEQKKNIEINTGMMVIPISKLKDWLPQMKPNNQQKEYYLTDLVHIASSQNACVQSHTTYHILEITGVNTRQQQIELERAYQRWQSDNLIQKGVYIIDPNRLDIRGSLSAGHDVTIDINCIFEGTVSLGNHVSIGAGCIIRNSHLADYTTVNPYSIIDQSNIASHCNIGPWARLRPHTKLAESVCIGNFVEIKDANISKNTKIKHLSYIGNADIGEQVNIGAGTITCNYDGINKYHTQIKNEVFIGANTALIAPLIIEEHATIGAGSTITQTAEAGYLTLSRVKQRVIKQWKRPR
ncbi:MAG: UDP-N-acetylglucosamine diphosphorylase/glucosamine-1-phosphate N-acetyltransferase [Endozoicomonadaceae bacterium]|nr:UDP-N-acetylglucosamine diphosphorylase/glucosamine-1-phosphate N-acetyltransferase [Endozoicomonadaceae bacterium]